MTADDPFAQIAAYFDDLVRRHGDDVLSCDYGGAESQSARFRVLAAVSPLDGRSVLEVGCGLAHFADYLDKLGVQATYTGIDVSLQMVTTARSRRPDLDVRLGNVLNDGIATADVVVANGIFYLLGADADELMWRLVERMWSLARVALVFTSLSTWAQRYEEGEFHADPIATLARCRTLTQSLVLRHDYLPHDFAVYLYR